MTLLFPNVFNEKLCEQMINLLKKWTETAILTLRNTQKNTEEMKTCAAIIDLFHEVIKLKLMFCF
jgi:uncharacterized protein with GYD domain